jgi:hypothetical protein
MDAKRFGRALGEGTRAVAKAVIKAADAAAAPNPAPTAPRPAHTAAAPRVTIPAIEPQRVVDTVRQVQSVQARAMREGRNATKQALAPVTRAVGTLGLEVTGVFFGIFALGMGTEAWRRRADLFAAGDAKNHALFVLALALAFAYFTVSNFVRASRRGKP